MAVNAAETFTAARATIWVGEVGSTAPADESAAPGTGWVNVGLTTPDSLSFSTEPEFEEVQSHQSDFPVRRIQTSEAATVSVDLEQWNKDTLVAAFGGGTVTEVTTGHYKFAPPTIGTRTEKAVMIDVADGANKVRIIVPRVMQIEGVELELSKGQAATLPLRFAVLGGDGVAAWYLLSNMAALEPAGA